MSKKLSQQWKVVTDERGASLLVCQWVHDAQPSAGSHTAA